MMEFKSEHKFDSSDEHLHVKFRSYYHMLWNAFVAKLPMNRLHSEICNVLEAGQVIFTQIVPDTWSRFVGVAMQCVHEKMTAAKSTTAEDANGFAEELTCGMLRTYAKLAEFAGIRSSVLLECLHAVGTGPDRLTQVDLTQPISLLTGLMQVDTLAADADDVMKDQSRALRALDNMVRSNRWAAMWNIILKVAIDAGPNPQGDWFTKGMRDALKQELTPEPCRFGAPPPPGSSGAWMANPTQPNPTS